MHIIKNGKKNISKEITDSNVQKIHIADDDFIDNVNWNMEVHMIGNIVTVKVDRPMESYHPEHKDMYYPINYGYIEGVIQG